MKSSFRSVHVALTVVGAIGLAAFANGCSAGPDGTEQTGETNQALLRPAPPRPIQSFDIISTETSVPTGHGQTCLNYYVPVPPTLAAQYDCTLGVQYQAVPDSSMWSYAFACKAGIKPPNALGLPPPVPDDGYFLIEAVFTWQTTVNACFGSPDPGWVLVVDEFTEGGIGGGGCRGAGCARGGE